MSERSGGQSFFLRSGRRLGDFLGRIASGCILLGTLSGVYSHFDEAFRSSKLFRPLSKNASNMAPSKISRICLIGSEESLFLRFLQGSGRFLLGSAVHSWGFFLLTYGGISLIRFLLENGLQTLSVELFFYLTLVILSVPLLTSDKSLRGVLERSVILSPLYALFGISRQARESAEVGRSHPLAASLWAIALVLLRWFFLSFSPLLFGGMLLIFSGIFFLPELLLVSFLAIFPFLSILPHPTYVLFGVLALLDVAWLWKALCGKRSLAFGFLDLTALLFALLYPLSAPGAIGGRETLLHSACFFFLFLSCFPIKSMLSLPIWRRRCLLALEGGACACALVGIWQYFFGNLELRWVDASRFSDLGSRVSASFSNPNILSVFLLLVLPLALSGASDERLSVWRRAFYGFSFLVEGGCLILTFTRGAWLGALAALLLWALLYSADTRGCFLLFLPHLSLIFISLPTPILHRFGSIGSFLDSSVRYRLYTWKGVKRMIQAHPFGIGSGEGSFVRIYPHYAVSGTERVMHAHALLLQIGAELGFLGAFAFLLFLVTLALYALKGFFWMTKGERGDLLGAVCGILGVLIMGFFDYVWYHPGMFFLFWMVCALASSYGAYGTVCGRERI